MYYLLQRLESWKDGLELLLGTIKFSWSDTSVERSETRTNDINEVVVQKKVHGGQLM